MTILTYTHKGKITSNIVGSTFANIIQKLFRTSSTEPIIRKLEEKLFENEPNFSKKITISQINDAVSIFENYLNVTMGNNVKYTNYIQVYKNGMEIYDLDKPVKAKNISIAFKLLVDYSSLDFSKVDHRNMRMRPKRKNVVEHYINMRFSILESITNEISLNKSEIQPEPVSEFSKINDYLDGLTERIDNKIDANVDNQRNKFYVKLRGFIEHEKEQNEECSLFPSTLDQIENKIYIKLIRHFLDLSDRLFIRNSQIATPNNEFSSMMSQNEDYIDDLCKNAIHTQLHLFSVFQKQDKNYQLRQFVKRYNQITVSLFHKRYNQITVLTKLFIQSHSHLPIYHSDLDIVREISLTLIGDYIKHQERYQPELAEEVYRYVINSEVFEPKIADIGHLNLTLGVDHRIENGILFEDFAMDYFTDFVNAADSIFNSDDNIESDLIKRINQMITWSSSNRNPSANINSIDKLYQFVQWKNDMYIEILGTRRYNIRNQKFQKYIGVYELLSELIVTYIDINDEDLEFLHEFYIRILLRYMIDLDIAHGFDSSKVQNEMESIIAKINPSQLFPIQIEKVRSIVYSMVVKDAINRENIYKDFDGDSQIIEMSNNSMILHENVESPSVKVDFKFNPTDENRQWIDEIYEFGTKMKTAQLGEELNAEGDIFIGDILDGLKARRHAINSLFITHNMNVDLHNLDLFIDIIKEMNKYFTFATEETDKLINRTERLIFMVISHEAIFIK